MEPTNNDQAEPEFEELLEFLQAELPDLGNLLAGFMNSVKRDEAQHDAQMELVSAQQRAAMAEADQEQNASESPEATTLAWGMWKSECGCIHFSVPDGKGGWASSMEQVEPEKLVEVVQSMTRSLGETGLTMLRALASTEEGI